MSAISERAEMKYLNDLTIQELKNIMRENNLTISEAKAELISRTLDIYPDGIISDQNDQGEEENIEKPNELLNDQGRDRPVLESNLLQREVEFLRREND